MGNGTHGVLIMQPEYFLKTICLSHTYPEIVHIQKGFKDPEINTITPTQPMFKKHTYNMKNVLSRKSYSLSIIFFWGYGRWCEPAGQHIFFTLFFCVREDLPRHIGEIGTNGNNNKKRKDSKQSFIWLCRGLYYWSWLLALFPCRLINIWYLYYWFFSLLSPRLRLHIYLFFLGCIPPSVNQDG